MEDWALTEDDRPAPAWLVYGLCAAAGVALVSLLLMALWLAAMFLIPMP